MKLMAFDPGGSTGWMSYALGTVVGGTLVIPDHHLELMTLMNDHDPDIVIYERFEHRNAPFAKLISNEYIGVIKLWGQKHPSAKLVPQGSSQAKRWCTNEKLSAAGLLLSPLTRNKNANDALRHFLFYVCNNKRAPSDLHHKYMEMLYNHVMSS